MNIYKSLAKKYGMSAFEVKREIQAVIDEVYKHPNTAALAVPRKDAVPTAEEFIDYVVSQLHEDPLEKPIEQGIKRHC